MLQVGSGFRSNEKSNGSGGPKIYGFGSSSLILAGFWFRSVKNRMKVNFFLKGSANFLILMYVRQFLLYLFVYTRKKIIFTPKDNSVEFTCILSQYSDTISRVNKVEIGNLFKLSNSSSISIQSSEKVVLIFLAQ